MTGEELLRKLGEGERDLKGVRTPDGCNLSQLENYDSVIDSLEGMSLADLRENPYDLSYSYLRGLIAPKIFLPCVKAIGVILAEAHLREAYLSEAKFPKADLWGADLFEAYLRRADLRRADLRRTGLCGADLSCTNLIKANLAGANIARANLGESDIRGAKNLSEVVNLGHAHFRDTTVGEEERRICQEAYDRKKTSPLFNVIQ